MLILFFFFLLQNENDTNLLLIKEFNNTNNITKINFIIFKIIYYTTLLFINEKFTNKIVINLNELLFF